MSREQLLAEILCLPVEERRGLIEQAVDSLSCDPVPDPDMTPELRAELDRRLADLHARPDQETSWERLVEQMKRRERQ